MRPLHRDDRHRGQAVARSIRPRLRQRRTAPAIRATSIRTDQFVRMIERRLDDLLGLDGSWGETVQGQRYQPGQEFQAHCDWFRHRRRATGRPRRAAAGSAAGRRWPISTMSRKAARPSFPTSAIPIRPQRGALLLWNNMLARRRTQQSDPPRRHAGDARREVYHHQMVSGPARWGVQGRCHRLAGGAARRLLAVLCSPAAAGAQPASARPRPPATRTARLALHLRRGRAARAGARSARTRSIAASFPIPAAFAQLFTDALDRQAASLGAAQPRRSRRDRPRQAEPRPRQLSYDIFRAHKREDAAWLQPDMRALTAVRPFNHFGGLAGRIPDADGAGRRGRLRQPKRLSPGAAARRGVRQRSSTRPSCGSARAWRAGWSNPG